MLLLARQGVPWRRRGLAVGADGQGDGLACRGCISIVGSHGQGRAACRFNCQTRKGSESRAGRAMWTGGESNICLDAAVTREDGMQVSEV